MAEKHPHAALLDRLGKNKVQTLYNIKDRTWREWRQLGVPGLYHNGLKLLASISGHSHAELGE